MTTPNRINRQAAQLAWSVLRNNLGPAIHAQWGNCIAAVSIYFIETAEAEAAEAKRVFDAAKGEGR